ncbi:hypothetical protein PIB30_074608 [Stylosanthes scabra]|uniref:Uncharacterized protein n=1 Tax=Stylosanthes scabra TaxID=79078 RepID=A0ABU6VNC8_9FABA|nr:hypothetical protein [Stylosanthes scabra]
MTSDKIPSSCSDAALLFRTPRRSSLSRLPNRPLPHEPTPLNRITPVYTRPPYLSKIPRRRNGGNPPMKQGRHWKLMVQSSSDEKFKLGKDWELPHLTPHLSIAQDNVQPEDAKIGTRHGSQSSPQTCHS